MTEASRVVLFDIDGVLLDSLPQHLQICRDKASEYALVSVVVPDAAEFRRMIDAGVRISPMLNFFLAVGFPEEEARRAVVDYEREFMVRYRPQPFPGIGSMLARLSDAGITLGLVTSNTRANVVPGLGSAMDFFDSRCLFYFDSYETPKSKAWYLNEALRILDVTAEQCVYVGDQPADRDAANQAKMHFIGVSFGWGLIEGSPGMVLADSIEELGRLLSQWASGPLIAGREASQS